MDSKEGKVAIYGNEAIYNVNVVAVIPSLGRDSTRENGRQWINSKKRKSTSFDAVLKSEEEKNRENDIDISTFGYTRNATATRTTIRMHEYVSPN